MRDRLLSSDKGVVQIEHKLDAEHLRLDREGLRPLPNGQSNPLCGIDTVAAQQSTLRCDRFDDLAKDIVAAHDHPLHAARPKPHDLAD